MIRWLLSLLLIVLVFLCFNSFVGCVQKKPDEEPKRFVVRAITNQARIDSLILVLDGLEATRRAQADPNSKASKKIYAEETFRFRMIDTLAAIYPVIANKPDSIKLAKLDSTMAEFVHADSTDDRGRKTRTRILKWLDLSLAERKQKVKNVKYIGKLVYASRNQLIAVSEQFSYAMFDGTPIRQVIKKLAIGRLYEGQGNVFTGFIFDNTTQFDNKLAMLRGQYFESEVK